MPRYKHPCGRSLQESNQMGWSLNDIPGVSSVIETVQDYTQTSIIDPIKATATEYVGEEKVQAWGDKLESTVQQQAASLQTQLQEKATAYAQGYLTQQAQTKSVQDAGIKGAFDAAATQAIQMKDTFLNQGARGFAKKYPVITGFAVGIPSLLFIKWMIGTRRAVYVSK